MERSGAARQFGAGAGHAMEVVHLPAKVRIAERVCPELRDIPVGDRERALHDASGVPFDIAELVGAALGLVLVAWLTHHGAHVLGSIERTLAGTTIALIAAPLVTLVLAGVLVRHLRRGLREQMAASGRTERGDDDR